VRKRLLPLIIILVGAVVAALVLSQFMGARAVAGSAQVTPTPLVLNQAAPASTRVPSAAPTLAGSGTTALNVPSVPSAKFTANLVSASQANLAFQAAGRVQELRVKEGDQVKAGDVLVVLDTATLRIGVQQAQASYDLAKAGYDKVKQGPTQDDITVAKAAVDKAKATLDQSQAAYDRIGGTSNPFIAMSQQSAALQQATTDYRSALAQYDSTKGHPTDVELRQAQAQVDQAQAALDLAKQNLANAALTAPFDGTVTNIVPKLGETVAPGAPVATLADLKHMQAQVQLDENSLANVKLNEPVTLTLDALGGKSLSGHVSKITPNGTSNGGVVSVPVTIDIAPSNSPIYPGLSAVVDFSGGAQ
jgi:HlyD family secretion protein